MNFWPCPVALPRVFEGVGRRGDRPTAISESPSLIPEFVAKWETGEKVVMAVKMESDESFLFSAIRSSYYRLVARLSSVEIVKNATGFGLYDKAFIDVLRTIEDPYPYFRGLVSDIGYPVTTIPFHRPQRKRGITSNNFYTLYDLAMLGITNHSKVPLPIATMAGFAMGTVSLLVAIGYLVAKLLFWYSFTVGIAPIIISLFFFSSVQLFFIGILGEYIGSIQTYVQKPRSSSKVNRSTSTVQARPRRVSRPAAPRPNELFGLIANPADRTPSTRKQSREFSFRRLVIWVGRHEPSQFGDCLVEAPLIAEGNHDQLIAVLLAGIELEPALGMRD